MLPSHCITSEYFFHGLTLHSLGQRSRDSNKYAYDDNSSASSPAMHCAPGFSGRKFKMITALVPGIVQASWTHCNTLCQLRGLPHWSPFHVNLNANWISKRWTQKTAHLVPGISLTLFLSRGLHVISWWIVLGYGAESMLASIKSIQVDHRGFRSYSPNTIWAPLSREMEPLYRSLLILMEVLKRCSLQLGEA